MVCRGKSTAKVEGVACWAQWFWCCCPAGMWGLLGCQPFRVSVESQLCNAVFSASTFSLFLSPDQSLLSPGIKACSKYKSLKMTTEALIAAKYHWLQRSHNFFAMWSFGCLFLCWGLTYIFILVWAQVALWWQLSKIKCSSAQYHLYAVNKSSWGIFINNDNDNDAKDDDQEHIPSFIDWAPTMCQSLAI